ncbi:MAG: alpha-galactosidase [Gemmatimonadota bacterium]|nr:alpha-galactosidase [Gemmatimonadota bacterium]
MKNLPAILSPLAVALASLVARPTPSAAQVPAPPNAAAAVRDSAGRLTLTYDGRAILTATIASTGAPPEARALVDTSRGAVTQVLKWTARGAARLTLTGTVRAGDEAFACAVEPPTDGVRLVRNAVGPAYNRLNRAVYDRRGDWVLSADEPTQVSVEPAAGAGGSTAFTFTAHGSEIILRFRPRYYQKHRGLAEYRPWTYGVWRRSVAGWSSWFAYFDKVTQADVERTADVMRDVLHPFGYDYLQIDDGFEREPIGTPANWLHPNAKFPSGLDSLAHYIAGRGLRPGIWTNVSFGDSAYAFAHPAEFVRDPGGAPARGRWVDYIMDGSNPATLDRLVRPVYDSLDRMGWRYYKLDALRHLRYEGYNSHADYFRARGLDRLTVYRGFVQAVRDAIGPNAFLLACWGIRPELIGLVDAVRVGTDGFGYGGFAEYNSFNNVVWRNDPDHVQLSAPDGYRAATLASLTGSLLMLTDQPALYRTARAEIAKRTAPVLFTQPEQIYDVDPSRSALIAQAATSVSGSGPRPFDADQRLSVPLYLLDVDRPFERWSVLARTGGADTVRFADLGLAPARDYLVFEFWAHRFLGVRRDAFEPGPIDPARKVQVFCIRERVAHPQVVATNRHVTCGGPDLERVAWHGDTLSGTSALVAGDPYELYLTELSGYRMVGVAVTGAKLVGTRVEGGLRVVRLLATGNSNASWSVRYAK